MQSINRYKVKLWIKKCIMFAKHPIITLRNRKSFTYIGKAAKIRVSSTQLVLGNETQIGDYARIQALNKHARIELEERVYIGDHLTVLASKNVEIKKDNLFASNVLITTENHSFDPEDKRSYGHQPLKDAPIIFEEGSWIGQNTCFIAREEGLRIGKRCVIGAGSIVTKSIPDYSVVAGVPAKIIKRYSFENHCWERV